MRPINSAVAPCEAPAVSTFLGWRAVVAVRCADYLQIVKPRISLLVLLTVAAGFALAGAETWRVSSLVQALAGIALVATSSSAFNQIFERRSDGLMRRTMNRPLPSGRMSAAEVAWFGLAAGIVGVLWLAFAVNLPTAVTALVTLLLYAGVYTPLKQKTSFATAVGAIPGAMPPVLGWLAAGARFDLAGFSLFAILFLWQFPHFLAIAWIYRDEYARAGLRMLPARGEVRHLTGLMATVYAMVLVPVSLLPAVCGLANRSYALVALVLGIGYLIAACRFARSESVHAARQLLWTSLVYLPVLLGMLVWNHFELLK